MRIGLDLTSTSVRHLSGTSLYALALARALPREAPQHQYLACFRHSALRRRAFAPDLAGEPLAVRYYWDRFDPLLARRLDIFHGLDSRAARFGKVRQVVTLHDVVSLWRDDFANAAGRARRRKVYEQVRRRADAILTPSQAEKEKIVEHLRVEPERVHVIPLAPAPGFEPLREPRREVLERHGLDAPYLLFVGVIQKRKNVLRLMEAHARLRTDVRLVLAGSVQPSFEAEFREGLARSPGVTPLGYVPNADLPSLYAGARAFAVPSEYESFGIPLLEAMSCGCPVAAARAGAMPEVSGGAAELFDPLSVDSMVCALERVLEESRAAELSKAGLERAAGFSYAKVARETLRVYESIL